jgi:hypothetical protein
LAVPMMLGGSAVDELTAWQAVVVGQATPSIVPVPDGTDSAFQLAPPSTVPMMAPVSKSPNPTAVQFETVGQARPSIPLTCVGTD